MNGGFFFFSFFFRLESGIITDLVKLYALIQELLSSTIACRLCASISRETAVLSNKIAYWWLGNLELLYNSSFYF